MDAPLRAIGANDAVQAAVIIPVEVTHTRCRDRIQPVDDLFESPGLPVGVFDVPDTRCTTAGVDDFGDLPAVVVAVSNRVAVGIRVALDPIQVIEGALDGFAALCQRLEVAVVVVERVIDRFRIRAVGVASGCLIRKQQKQQHGQYPCQHINAKLATCASHHWGSRIAD